MEIQKKKFQRIWCKTVGEMDPRAEMGAPYSFMYPYFRPRPPFNDEIDGSVWEGDLML